MTIHDTYTSKRTGKTWDIQYEELDSFDSIRHLPVNSEGALCFCDGKLVLVYSQSRDVWEIPGGGREEGESFEDCIVREIKEESNMKVLELYPLGYDINTHSEAEVPHYVLRYAARVEPYGDFTGDGAEDSEITEIKLIDPADYKQYFDWGERSDAMMEKALKYIK